MKDASHDYSFGYVKPCESGKAFASIGGSHYNIHKCINSEFLPRTLNDDCNNDEDRPWSLICTSKQCKFDGDKPYNGYCPEGKAIDSTHYKCKEKTNWDKWSLTDDNGIPISDVNYDDNNSPSFFRKCGLIDLKKWLEVISILKSQ